MAKVAVSSQGKGLESQVDPRFGRAAYFLVVDTETMDTVVLDNSQARNMSHGAGIQAAELVSRAGAEAVLSGFVGPKAMDALQAAGLAVYQDVAGVVDEAVRQYARGELNASTEANGMPVPGGGRGSGRR